MSALQMADLVRSYGKTRAVDGISLSVEAGELVALLGPSGCGKTTLLRLIAGLMPPDEGRILIAGRDVTALSARHRQIGMVFQSYALFPNLTVAGNVGFPLDARGWPWGLRAARIEEMLALVGLTALASRLPAELSGGQQQRVALARALASRPHLLLLDEPLSALDALTRHGLRDEIRRIQLEVGMAALYVTHDQAEAMAIADRIAVMEQGRIAELGSPRAIYEHPATVFGAQFLGTRNLLELSVGPDGRVALGAAFSIAAQAPSGTVMTAAFTPEAVQIGGESGEPVRVLLVSFRGPLTRVMIESAAGAIAADVPSTSVPSLERGAVVRFRVPGESITLFPCSVPKGSRR